MINLRLSDFIDIVSKSGISKTNTILSIKNRPPYQPAFDYYKPLREHIINLHKHNKGKKELLYANDLTSDKKKWENYNIILSKYREFWGRKTLKWFDPPKKNWFSNEIAVTLNPELGLLINDVPYVIKLYLKGEKLSKAKTTISLFLMNKILPTKHIEQTPIYSILDVRQGTLIKTSVFPPNTLSSLIAETAYINIIWNMPS
jgi:hypothetical protein